MLKMLVLLGLALGLCLAGIVGLLSYRDRRRRHSNRARRAGDYAERQAQWRTYLSLNRSRRVPRITDQRDAED